MKSLKRKIVFEKLSLLSLEEKAANQFEFSDGVNIIIGANDTGKSSLIRSIYSSLGAATYKDARWAEAKAIVALEFRVDEKHYVIINQNGNYKIECKNDSSLFNFKSVTKELSPFLAEVFHFHLKLSTKSKGELIHAPPAFLFLPFYIDQDLGWVKALASFERLTQFSSWKKQLLDYHYGFRPNEYYDLYGKNEETKKTKTTIDSDIKSLDSLLYTHLAKKVTEGVEVDIEEFRKDIDQLLLHGMSLAEMQNKYNHELVELNSSKWILQKQLKSAIGVRDELKESFGELANSEHGIECPTCGSEYENDYETRLELAKDTGEINKFIEELNAEVEIIDERIKLKKKDIKLQDSELDDIKRVLSLKKSEVSLQDVLRSQGRAAIIKEMTSSMESQQIETLKLDSLIKKNEKELRKFNNKKKKDQFFNDYHARVTGFFKNLNLDKIQPNAIKDLYTEIKESGSDLPRALIAIFYSRIISINDNAPPCFVPIVIDSPNQNAQDEGNMESMYEFIFNNHSDTTQLILGTEKLDQHQFPEGARVIKLSSSYSLLDKKKYDEVASYLAPYLL